MVEADLKIQAPVKRSEKVTISPSLALAKKAKELGQEVIDLREVEPRTADTKIPGKEQIKDAVRTKSSADAAANAGPSGDAPQGAGLISDKPPERLLDINI